jgi:transposase
VLVTATDDLRARLEPLTDRRLIDACADFAVKDLSDPDEAMRHTLGCLARRWLDLDDEIKIHSGLLKTHTRQAAPALVDAFGIGPDVAAELLVAAGDNTNRIRYEAALAKMCGACPIPASSGRTDGRHRLNRGGNRQAYAALYRTIIVRMRWQEPTITYVEKRTAQGLTKKDIIRCLKRYLVREVYRLLPQPTTRAQIGNKSFLTT